MMNATTIECARPANLCIVIAQHSRSSIDRSHYHGRRLPRTKTFGVIPAGPAREFAAALIEILRFTVSRRWTTGVQAALWWVLRPLCDPSWSELRDNDVAPSSGQRLRRARSDRMDVDQKTQQLPISGSARSTAAISVADPVIEIASVGCWRPQRYGTSGQHGRQTHHFNNEDTE
jgi:hypothetical protein